MAKQKLTASDIIDAMRKHAPDVNESNVLEVIDSLFSALAESRRKAILAKNVLAEILK